MFAASTVRSWAPVTAPPKVTAEPVKVVSAPSVAAPWYSWAPAVFTEPPSSAEAPVTVREVNGAVSPTASRSSTSPSTMRARAPSKVLVNTALEATKVASEPRLTAWP